MAYIEETSASDCLQLITLSNGILIIKSSGAASLRRLSATCWVLKTFSTSLQYVAVQILKCSRRDSPCNYRQETHINIALTGGVNQKDVEEEITLLKVRILRYFLLAKIGMDNYYYL